MLLLRVLNPFSYPEISDFFFSVKPQDRGGSLKILEHVMAFSECEILLAPLAQIMWKGDDFHIVPASEQLFCLLAFDAVL